MSIRQTLKKNESLNHLAAGVYSFLKNFGRCRKNANCTGAYLSNVRFSVADNSHVQIGNLARLQNCSFSISGRNSRIIIGGG